MSLEIKCYKCNCTDGDILHILKCCRCYICKNCLNKFTDTKCINCNKEINNLDLNTFRNIQKNKNINIDKCTLTLTEKIMIEYENKNKDELLLKENIRLDIERKEKLLILEKEEKERREYEIQRDKEIKQILLEKEERKHREIEIEKIKQNKILHNNVLQESLKQPHCVLCLLKTKRDIGCGHLVCDNCIIQFNLMCCPECSKPITSLNLSEMRKLYNF